MRWVIVLAVLVAVVVIGISFLDVDEPESIRTDEDRAAPEVVGRTSSPEAEEDEPGGPATVVGTVTCDDRPCVANIEVRRLRDGDDTWLLPPVVGIVTRATAGEKGGFRIMDLPSGRYEFTAVAGDGASSSTRETLKPGLNDDIRIIIQWGEENLRGRAIYSDGRAFDGIVIVSAESGGTWPVGGRFCRPGSDGRFRMEGLLRGRSFVSLHLPGQFRTAAEAVTVPHEGELVFVADRDLTRLTGHVFSLADGRPVAGAHVEVRGPFGDTLASEAETVTSGDGNFAVSIPGEAVYLTVNAKGFRSWGAGLRGDRTDVTVRLSSAAIAITGIVLEADSGRPVPGVPVLTCRPNSRPGRSRNLTDADGRFEIGPVMPGANLILVRTDEWISQGFAEGDVKGHLPLAVDVREGTREIVLTVVPAPRVTGKVIGPDGKGVGGAKIEATTHWSIRRLKPWVTWPLETKTAPDGTYSLAGLCPDIEYRLKVRSDSHPIVTTEAFSPAAGETHVLDVRLEAGYFVHMVVVESGTDRPVAGTYVDGRVTLESGGSHHIGIYRRTGADGTLRLGPFPEGRRSVRARHSEYLDTKWLPETPRIELERGEAIAGRVLLPDGSPASGARVSLISMPEEREVTQEIRADRDGRFRVGGLEKGTYTVGAFVSRRDQFHEASAVVVAGTEGLELRLAKHGRDRKGGRVVARVLDPDGSPVALGRARRISFEHDALTTMYGHVIEGEVSISFWRPDEFWIDVYDARGRGDVLLGATMVGPFPAETKEVTVQMPLALSIAGVVVDRDGVGVRGVRLDASPVIEKQPPKTGAVSPHANTWTDHKGRFALTGLGTSRYRVTVNASKEHKTPEPLTVEAGTENLTIALGGTVTARLTLLDYGGRPVEGVSVSVRSVGNHETGPDGCVDVGGLDPEARYVVWVGMRSGRYDLKSFHIGDWAPKDETIRFERVWSIAGMVVDAEGSPVEGAEIWRTDTKRRVAGTNESGRFRIRDLLEPGTLPLVALGDGMDLSEAAVLPVQATTGDEGIALTVDRGGEINIRITDWPDGVEAMGYITFPPDTRAPEEVQILPDGTFVRRGLPRNLEVGFLVRLPERNLVACRTGMRPGSGVQSIALVTGLKFTGRVDVPKEATSVWVSFWRHDAWGYAKPNKDGTYEIPAVPPGRFKVFATARDASNKQIARADQEAEAGTRVDLDLR
jgi:5-hydroxyisourate hydrolase-like protein (transthyretin family)